MQTTTYILQQYSLGSKKNKMQAKIASDNSLLVTCLSDFSFVNACTYRLIWVLLHLLPTNILMETTHIPL